MGAFHESVLGRSPSRFRFSIVSGYWDAFGRCDGGGGLYLITDKVVLSDVRVLSAKTGGRTRITLLLENLSAERVSFGGITIADAGYSRIAASLGNGLTTILASIPIASGEILSVDGEVLWIEADGLAKDLRPGGEIKAAVNFGALVIPINLTVEYGNKPSN
jgi:hypothetical protein